MDKKAEEVDLRLELTSSTVESDNENEVTTDNIGKNISKDSGVNMTPMKSGSNQDMDLKEISFLEEKCLDLSDKVTIDEFVDKSDNNSAIHSIVLVDDDESDNIIIQEVPEINDFIEVDAVGQVDEMDRAFISKDGNSDGAVVICDDPYGFSEEEIELSSDEEEPAPTDVSLLCLKRPVLTETTVECLDILDSDEEFPVCLVESKKPAFIMSCFINLLLQVSRMTM